VAGVRADEDDDDDDDDDDGVWLEFRQLDTLTDCRRQSTATRRGGRQIRRSKLVVYVHGNDTSAGKHHRY